MDSQQKIEPAEVQNLPFQLTLGNEKGDKYLDLARELKELWNMKVTVNPIKIDIGTKGLLQGLGDLEIRGRIESIQTTALLRPARIERSVQLIWGGLLSHKLELETISWRWCEKLSKE